jgi:hypothetical protein
LRVAPSSLPDGRLARQMARASPSLGRGARSLDRLPFPADTRKGGTS